MIVASALRFATQLLNVSVPQAIGWSQIEISLAIILACAPMSTKLLFTPLIDACDIEKVAKRQTGGTPTYLPRRLGQASSQKPRPYEQEGPQQLVNVRRPQLVGGIGNPSGPNRSLSEAEKKTERLLDRVAQEEKSRSAGPLGSFDDLMYSKAPREISSPDYQRLKVVRAEVNGQSIWEV